MCIQCESELVALLAEGNARHNYIFDVIIRYACLPCYREWCVRHDIESPNSERVGFVDFDVSKE
jgi:hypothetical protein